MNFMDERNHLAPTHQTEHLAIRVSPQSSRSLKESLGSEIPKAVYPEIRAITANKPTRNKTYYPYENLCSSQDGKRGIITYLYPYPKPILYQHDAESGHAEVFGRSKYVAMAEEGGVRFVDLIPEITDPVAIQKVLDGRFLTVSIGSESDWVKCSICGCNRHEDFCDHNRGDVYKLKGGELAECVWHIGPMVFEELSFVICPSDQDARVLKVHTDLAKVPLLKAESLKLGDTFVESNRKFWNFAVEESARILESLPIVESPGPDDEVTEPEEVLTMGALYDLAEDDPDFDTPAEEYPEFEAKLSSKQRKALPDSAWCGPSKSFPANDLNHARVGLSMLARSKAPNKDKIRACLQRRLAKFKGKDSCIALLSDSKLLAEFPILAVNPGNAVEMGTILEESGIPDIYKSGMQQRLAYLCKREKCPRHKSLSEAYESLGNEEVGPVVIEMDGETYPILYTVIETLMATINREETEHMGEEIVVEAALETPEVVVETTEEVVVVAESTEAGTPAVIEEARADELTELLVRERAASKGFRAETAAVLALVLHKPLARGKGFEALTKELSGRSLESLSDMVKDALLELESGPPSSEVPPVENPVLAGIPLTQEERDSTSVEALVAQIEVTSGEDTPEEADSTDFLSRYGNRR